MTLVKTALGAFPAALGLSASAQEPVKVVLVAPFSAAVKDPGK